MARLTKSEVRHIAELAGFDLSEGELRKFQRELSDTLSYIEILERVKTKGIDSTSQVTGLKNVVRNDKATFSLPVHEALLNVKQKHTNFIKAKIVL